MGAAEDGEPCLYTVLQVGVDATSTELRAQYKRLARKYHPDKAWRQNANPQGMDCTPDGLSNHDMFSLISHAYEVLNDPTKRATYDMLKGHASAAGYGKLNDMKRKDAERAVELMRMSFDVKRRTELSIGGLVIDDAVYGPTSLIETTRIDDLANNKAVLNVTRQLQCAVENSKLVVPGGEPKFHWITGLYDPSPGEDKTLWVRYYFKGKLHKVVVSDSERLLMPLRSHSMAEQNKKKARRVSSSAEPSSSRPSAPRGSSTVVGRSPRSSFLSLSRVLATVSVVSVALGLVGLLARGHFRLSEPLHRRLAAH